MASDRGRVKALTAKPQPNQFLRQPIQRRIAETMAGNGLQMVVHPLGIIDRAVGQGGGDRLDGARQGVHGLGALGRLTQFGRRAAPASAHPATWARSPPALLIGLTLLLLLVKAGDAGVSTPAFVTGMAAFALAMGNLAMAVRWTCTRKADAEDSNTFPRP